MDGGLDICISHESGFLTRSMPEQCIMSDFDDNSVTRTKLNKVLNNVLKFHSDSLKIYTASSLCMYAQDDQRQALPYFDQKYLHIQVNFFSILNSGL